MFIEGDHLESCRFCVGSPLCDHELRRSSQTGCFVLPLGLVASFMTGLFVLLAACLASPANFRLGRESSCR